MKETTPLLMNARCKNTDMDFRLRNCCSAAEQMIFDQIIKRDEHKCHYCSFKSSEQQEVHHLDHDHANNSPDNLVTVCTFCHMAHHISELNDFLNPAIIWMPEISQSNLNHLVRSCLVAQCYVYEGIIESAGKKVLQKEDEIDEALLLFRREFQSRKDMTIELVGTAIPTNFGGGMAMLVEKEIKYPESVINGFRLLPDDIQSDRPSKEVQEMVRIWRTEFGPYERLTPESWIRLSENCEYL